jgi:hypothetical protein
MGVRVSFMCSSVGMAELSATYWPKQLGTSQVLSGYISPCPRNIGLCGKAESGRALLRPGYNCPKCALLFVVVSCPVKDTVSRDITEPIPQQHPVAKGDFRLIYSLALASFRILILSLSATWLLPSRTPCL